MRPHRRQVKRLRVALGRRVLVQRVSCRTPGVCVASPFWRVYLVQTPFVRRVIGQGTSRRAALRDALDHVRARQTAVSAGRCHCGQMMIDPEHARSRRCIPPLVRAVDDASAAMRVAVELLRDPPADDPEHTAWLDRADAEQMRHDLPAFLDATGGAEGPWCVRYDAETGPVRVPVRAEIKTAALERASGTGAHDHARGDVCPGEDPGAPTNAATEGL